MQISGATSISARYPVLNVTAPRATALSAGQSMSAGNPPTAPDFTNMTSKAFEVQAKAMYDRGDIDFSTLGVLQVNAHMAQASGTTDWVSHFQGLAQFEVQRGNENNPTSPYSDFQSVLRLMARGSGVDLTA